MNNYATTMSQGTSPVIGFIDIDSFECQLWQRDFPRFRGKPCVVTNNPSGRILSVTNEAKLLGVSRSCTPFIHEARAICPTLHEFRKPNSWGKPDSKKTRAGTWEILDCILEFCAEKGDDIIVQLASSDEFYLDISSEITRRMEKKLKSPYSKWNVNVTKNIVHESAKVSRPGPFRYELKRFVRNNTDIADYYRQVQQDEDRLVMGALFMSELCKYLYQKTKLSSSAGVGNNKLLAKIGCGINKPKKVTTFQNAAFIRMSSSIAIKNIPGLGGPMGEDLMQAFNIKLVSELRKLCLSDLEEHCDYDPKLAMRIFSRARGNDDQPVVHLLMKDGLICNKPLGDVRSLNHLKLVIGDLSEEILDRLEEEKRRHKRITKQVRLGFTLEDEDGEKESGNTFLEVNSEVKSSDLSEQGMNFILEHPNFNRRKFRIVELKFAVNEFIFMDSLDGAPETTSKSLVVGPKNYLPVNCKTDHIASAPTFSNYKQIGSFRTTRSKKNSSSGVHLPKLIPLDRLLELKGINLESGYADNPTKLFDYTTYNELKHRFFIKWLRKIKYMDKVRAGKFKKPDFVGFSGRFAAPMRSPAVKQFGDWEVYATNIEDIIYIWDERKPRFEDTRQTYFGTSFEKLAVEELDADTASSDFEMPYIVNELTLGPHQLLVVSNVDAVDANGDWVEISTWRLSHTNAMFAKMLRAWSQCSVHGVKRLVVGARNDQGVLEDIQIKSLEDMETFLDDGPTKCMHFENRLLSFIKAHLPESNGNIVKKFSWTCGNRSIVCGTVQQQGIPNLVLTRLYSSYFKSITRNSSSPDKDEV